MQFSELGGNNNPLPHPNPDKLEEDQMNLLLAPYFKGEDNY